MKLYIIGNLDKKIYSCISKDIFETEVIITEERIEHIKHHHPGDFEKYYSFLQSVIEDPDYIVKANKPNTGVVLKEFEKDDCKIKLVLRIKTKEDSSDYKNSVISFWTIGDTTWKKILKNKNILYIKE